MKKAIDGYEKEKTTLHSLFLFKTFLEDCLSQLPESEWKDSLITQWWELEFVYAMMIDNNEDSFSIEEIYPALTKMKSMIYERTPT